MSSYENSSLSEIEAVLDGLEEASSSEVFDATRPYAPRAIAAVAASRADAAGGGGGGSILTAAVSLTDAQIKALGTESAGAVEVVAPPGAGQWINLIHALVSIDAAAATYTNIDTGASLYFRWDAPVGAAATSAVYGTGSLRGLLGEDGEQAAVVFPVGALIYNGVAIEAAYYDESQIANKALTLYGYNNGAGAFTGGNAANSGRAKVWYTVEALA